MTSAPHVTEKQQQRRRSDPSADPSAALFCPLKIPIFLFLSPLLFPGGGTGRGVRGGGGVERGVGGVPFRCVVLLRFRHPHRAVLTAHARRHAAATKRRGDAAKCRGAAVKRAERRGSRPRDVAIRVARMRSSATLTPKAYRASPLPALRSLRRNRKCAAAPSVPLRFRFGASRFGPVRPGHEVPL